MVTEVRATPAFGVQLPILKAGTEGEFRPVGGYGSTAESIGKPKPELLSPAGDMECIRAAVENGADAVYFGLHRHNARARAHNFDLNALDDIVPFLHRRGVRGYVTLNTLAFSDELPEFESLIRAVANAGVDAVIVQDLGVAQLSKAICPTLETHASTQMTLTSAESIRFVERLGIDRVILARELSMREMRLIRQRTTMPLECFVHGALCVAYSGQCLTSEALGGRSANRGECAQACRLPYEAVCDGETVDLGPVKYLLSPQDLAAYSAIPELVALGISSLKIEGRLKTPEYVANITRHYREAIDCAVAGKPVEFSPRSIEEMELTFSRGFHTGWMHGNNHKRLVHGLSSSKRGVRLGKTLRVHKGRVEVRLTTSLKRGDGVAFEGGDAEKPQIGGRVYELFADGRSIERAEAGDVVQFALARDVRLHAIPPGAAVWKTDDPELMSRLRRTFASGATFRKVGLELRIHAESGSALRLSFRTAAGRVGEIDSGHVLSPATKHPLTIETLEKQFRRLGGTIFRLDRIDATIIGGPMVPLSVLGGIRKTLVERLETMPDHHADRLCASDSPLAAWRREIATSSASSDGVARLAVLCRDLRQLRQAADLHPDRLYVDFQDIREYREAVKIARSSGLPVFLATPRIQKPLEGPLFRHLLRQRADGILARNLAALDYFTQMGVATVADFSLNASNELSCAILQRSGVERVTASYDLDADQLLALSRRTPAGSLEVVAYQHMPMFHMEHCVYCAFLSPGTDRTNCGRPCDRHEVKLRDRERMEHPLRADVGCRNTVFNAVPQSAAECIPRLLDAGVRHFRVELLDESPDEIVRVVQAHRDLIGRRISAKDIWKQLRALNRLGVTRGTLDPQRRSEV